MQMRSSAARLRRRQTTEGLERSRVPGGDSRPVFSGGSRTPLEGAHDATVHGVRAPGHDAAASADASPFWPWLPAGVTPKYAPWVRSTHLTIVPFPMPLFRCKLGAPLFTQRSRMGPLMSPSSTVARQHGSSRPPAIALS